MFHKHKLQKKYPHGSHLNWEGVPSNKKYTNLLQQFANSASQDLCISAALSYPVAFSLFTDICGDGMYTIARGALFIYCISVSDCIYLSIQDERNRKERKGIVRDIGVGGVVPLIRGGSVGYTTISRLYCIAATQRCRPSGTHWASQFCFLSRQDCTFYICYHPPNMCWLYKGQVWQCRVLQGFQ